MIYHDTSKHIFKLWYFWGGEGKIDFNYFVEKLRCDDWRTIWRHGVEYCRKAMGGIGHLNSR